MRGRARPPGLVERRRKAALLARELRNLIPRSTMVLSVRERNLAIASHVRRMLRGGD